MANAVVHNGSSCTNAFVRGGGKVLQHAAGGGMSRHGKQAAVFACVGVTATTAMLAAPATCSAAPPSTISRPTVSHTVWTETELTAPTKHGKLKRRKGGGGGGDDDANRLDDAAGSGGNFDGFHGGFDGGDGGGGWGDGDDWWNNHHFSGGGGGGGDDWLNNNGGGGGGGGGGGPEDGNLMWAWQTICGVAFAGSVQHIVERSLPLVSRMVFSSGGGAGEDSAAAAAAETVGLTAMCETAGGVEAAAGGGGLCLASMTTAHLARHQPVLSMSISAA